MELTGSMMPDAPCFTLYNYHLLFPYCLQVTNKPSSTLVTAKMSKNSRATLKNVRNFCRKSYYRRDLEDAAVRRASAILRSQRPITAVQKRRTRKKQT